MDGERLVSQHRDKLAKEAGDRQARGGTGPLVAGSQLEEEESGTGQIKFQCLSQQTMVQ